MPLDAVTGEMRARAKTINFATIYGQGAFALSRQLKIEHAEAKAFIAALGSEGLYKGRKIVTEVEPAKTFFEAEEYHQDYYLKNPVRYKYYRWNCGRDQRLEQIWGSEAIPH